MKIEPFPSDWGKPKLDAPPELDFTMERVMEDKNFPEFLNKIMQDLPDLPPLPEGWQWRPDTHELVDFSAEPATIKFKWTPVKVHHFQD